jgi:hypothetical protein
LESGAAAVDVSSETWPPFVLNGDSEGRRSQRITQMKRGCSMNKATRIQGASCVKPRIEDEFESLEGAHSFVALKPCYPLIKVLRPWQCNLEKPVRTHPRGSRPRYCRMRDHDCCHRRLSRWHDTPGRVECGQCVFKGSPVSLSNQTGARSTCSTIVCER